MRVLNNTLRSFTLNPVPKIDFVFEREYLAIQVRFVTRQPQVV